MMKKQILGIVLLFFLVAPIVFTFSVFQYNKTMLRKEIKHRIISGIEKEDLVLLKFTKSEIETQLDWQHSKEFEYDGEMYDIIDKEIKGDVIYFWCWCDNKETALNKQLDELFTYALGKNQTHNKSQKQLMFFYKTLFFEKNKDFSFLKIIYTQYIKIDYRFNYLSFKSTPPLPPPKLV